jgi:hypothetical protein
LIGSNLHHKLLLGLPNPNPAREVTPVKVTFLKIENKWRDIAGMVPKWHESGEWDAIINLGEHPAFTDILIEQYANRLGYYAPDVVGEEPPKVDGGGHGLEGEVDRWYSNVDSAALYTYLTAVLGFEHIQEHGQ